MIEALIEEQSVATTATDLLDRARTAKHAEHAATAEQLRVAAEWCDLHPAESIHDAARHGHTGLFGRERGVPIAGQGVPLVAEFCLAELGAALSMPTQNAKDLAGQALELRHRLPRCWARVMDLTLPAWRARRIADATMHLSIEAASFVDTQISRFAHKIGPAAVERLIDDATQRFMPDLAEAERVKAADGRHVGLDFRTESFTGTAKLHGELDLADALDLDTTLNQRATALADAGCEESLDVRRAIALGDLARGHDSLTLQREVVLHVHTTAEALAENTTGHTTQVARLETGGRRLITLEQVRTWCAGAATITVRPVVDLTETIHVEAYEIPDRLAHQTEERDLTCTFPWCTKPAAGCDKDHTIPHSQGGATTTDNIANLCRSHHRLKTHTGWTYHCLDPGTYLWTSPHGLTLLRGPTGSELL